MKIFIRFDSASHENSQIGVTISIIIFKKSVFRPKNQYNTDLISIVAIPDLQCFRRLLVLVAEVRRIYLQLSLCFFKSTFSYLFFKKKKNKSSLSLIILLVENFTLLFFQVFFYVVIEPMIPVPSSEG